MAPAWRRNLVALAIGVDGMSLASGDAAAARRFSSHGDTFFGPTTGFRYNLPGGGVDSSAGVPTDSFDRAGLAGLQD
jgi:hypothetical protein